MQIKYLFVFNEQSADLKTNKQKREGFTLVTKKN